MLPDEIIQYISSFTNNKCHTCNKKLPLMPIICKCGFNFCCSHRHPEDHQCTFNHKNEQQKLSDWNNQQIYNHAKIKVGKIYSQIK